MIKRNASTQADASLVECATRVKVLTRLSWPQSVMTTFLADYQRGNPKLPNVEYQPGEDLADVVRALEQIIAQVGEAEEPTVAFVRNTARSYLDACLLLQNVGTRDMQPIANRLYGGPSNQLSGGQGTNLDMAKHVIDVTEQYYRTRHLVEADYCISDVVMKAELQARLLEVFPADTISVSIDPSLASKAAAGATRIRLRSGTCYSEYDLEQLLQHEAFVHSLTALNGRAQPSLASLSLGAPRTTATQEGLATFAEMVTGAIDIDRLERLALRVIAIDHALQGANFIDVFELYLNRGQSEIESFNSTMRVFRGAPLDGGYAFTKDAVYIYGLIQVHTFFKWAMHHQRLDLCRNLFAGRMTISDAMALTPMFESGELLAPHFLPPWMTRANGLAGYLAFSALTNRFNVEELDADHTFEFSDVDG